MRDLARYWYGRSPLMALLAPLSALFQLAVSLRREAYRHGYFKVVKLPVPVIVVGNITVGGTGKTPLVAWLAGFLKQHGYRPGLVSRGYGGQARNWPQQVRPDSDTVTVGDEAVLLARQAACPMAVAPDRIAAAQALIEHNQCDIIIADDGLQHYAMARDIEIAVIDGIRRFGNGYCLPAGPLREPVSRLNEVDIKVTNGLAGRGEFAMKLVGDVAHNLVNESHTRLLSEFAGSPVHAVAGIGHPARFFTSLQRYHLTLIEHPFPDHYRYRAEDLMFGDARPILMTEKDAVKCRRIASERCWFVPVVAQPDERLGERILNLLQARESHG